MTINSALTKDEIMTNSVSNVRANIWKMALVVAANQALFVIPVIFPFFQENGLAFKHVIWLQGFFGLAVMFLEVPSGYISDRWGRKRTMITGSIIGVTGMLVYAASTTFQGFLVGEFLLAVMVSFYSGTKEAIVYDTLLEIGDEKEYRRLIGQQQFFGFLSEAVASVGGGLIAIVALRLTVWATIFPLALGLFVVMFIQEPRRHVSQEKRHLRAIWDVSANSLVKNRPLRSIIVLNAVISSLTLTLVWFTQPYQEMVGLPLYLFGVVHASIMFMTGYASKLVYRLERVADDRMILIAVAFVVVLSYLVLGFVTSLWGLAILFAGRVMFGFLLPLTSEMINSMTTSEVRGTVLSMKSLVAKLVFGIMTILVGHVSDIVTLNQTILVVGVLSGGVLLVIFTRMASVWKQIPR